MGHSVFFPAIDPALLVPTAADLAEIAAVLLTALLLISLGRLLTRGRLPPELALLAGWGVLAVAFTLWGALVPTAFPLWWPAAALAAVGAIALFLPGVALHRGEWAALGRAMTLSLPFWVVLASEFPSQPDTFLNLLPNAAYLYDHGFLPAATRPDSHSFLPGAPYNLQFWGYFAALPLPFFPAAAMARINLVLLLAFGLLLARVLESAPMPDPEPRSAPGWGVTAAGLLLATALNPGFVPRVWLAVYGETAIAVCLGAAGYLIARGFAHLPERTIPWSLLGALAATMTALVEIKQESVAFVIALGLAIAVLGMLDRRVGFLRASRSFLPAFLPPVLLYLLWRWYVSTHLAGGELGLLPYREWNWAILPEIARAILGVIAEKGVYFSFLLIAFLLLLWRVQRHGFDFASRMLALTVAVTLAYDLFLVVAYVVTFVPKMAQDAHSFFRYNTHVALILVLSLAALARAVIAEHEGVPRAPWHVAAAAAIGAILLFPAIFAGRLRFDLTMPQPLIRALTRDVAGFLAPNEKLALVLPGDGGGIATMMEGILRYEAPRRPGIDLEVRNEFADDTLSQLAGHGVTKALVSCVPDGFADLPAGDAVLLERRGSEWQKIAAWRYPPRGERRWAASLPAAALCESQF